MAIVRWNPWGDVATLQARINRVFDDAFARSERENEELAVCNWQPAVDIYDAGDRIVLKAELPGVAREQISIS